jgi:hypothetical protein
MNTALHSAMHFRRHAGEGFDTHGPRGQMEEGTPHLCEAQRRR